MLHKSDYKYFSKARHVAELSDFKQVHVGCVAVYKKNIIGVGYNTNKTHPLQKKYDKFRFNEEDPILCHKLHAEINCINEIRHMDIPFHKVKLYIYRKCTERPFGISRPCASCMAAIKELGIRNIFYTTDTGYAFEKLVA